MANHGPSYGLSRELEKKNQARFNIDEAIEVLQWIEEVTGIQLEHDPREFQTATEVSDALKDGVMLCVDGCGSDVQSDKGGLMNRLVGTRNGMALRYHQNPKMPFHKMENISNFLEAIKAYGVSEISCFQTVDLYENKQCYKVVECLRALAAVAQNKDAPVPFPIWVVKIAQGKPRKFPEAVIRQGDAIIPLQYGTNKCASQKGMTPYGLARQIKPDMTGPQDDKSI